MVGPSPARAAACRLRRASPKRVARRRATARKARSKIVRRWLALCLLAAGLAGCRPGPATLSDLNGLGELKDRFSRDTGTIRIVLLLSPT